MIPLLLAAACVLLIPLVFGRQAATSAWTSASPRTAIAAHTGALLAWMFSILALISLLLIPLLEHVGGLSEFLDRCPQLRAALEQHPFQVALALAGLAGIGAVLVLVARSSWRQRTALRTARDEQSVLQLLATRCGDYGVIEHEKPIAWSAPKGAGTNILISSAAVELLDPQELDAVIAHERAHVTGRHHHLIAIAQVMRAALPCRFTRESARAVQDLVELAADDKAASGDRELHVRAALQKMAPATANGQTVTPIEHRVARLLDVNRSPSLLGAVAVLATLTAFLLPATAVILEWNQAIQQAASHPLHHQ